MQKYEAVIGLETHIQLNTTTKIFCSCKADSWNDPPNTNICPVCVGLPGVLPVLNKFVVEKALLLAISIHADINLVSYFDRKNYFYPDLPKGYQISQYDKPLAENGYFELPISNGQLKKIKIQKMHIEEDAGKTKNENGRRLIDFNRCGVPLVEMVTAPDIRTADEAAKYLTRLRQLLRWIGVSEADMEKGHLRCDANVSIRPVGTNILNPKTEIKNVNSILAVRDAIQKEIERQIQELGKGNQIETWTLDWDDETKTLRKMRSKETEADYRYFREPDLLPLEIENDQIDTLASSLPELPLERWVRFIKDYKIPEYDADILTGERTIADYFESTVKSYQGDPKRVSNWIINDILRITNEYNISANNLKITPEYLAKIIILIDNNVINSTTGKNLLDKVQSTSKDPQEIVESEGLIQINDLNSIRSICEQIVRENPEQVLNYKKGKTTLIGWFVGQVMREMKGKADPQLTRVTLEELLSK